MNSSESHLKYSTGGTEFGFTTFVKYLLFLRQPFTNTVLFGKFCQQKFRGFVGVFFFVFCFFLRNLAQSQLKCVTGKHLRHYY